MRKTIIIILLCIIQLGICTTINAAGIGTWNAYMAYHDVQQIAAAGDDIFVLASDNLYQYNKNDESITTYDKVRGLSDTKIKKIAWSKTAKRLIVVYENSNIDLVETNGEVTNISDLYTKSMTEDKTVNNITIYGKYAYLATGFGVVKVNMTDAEISESYILNEKIEKVIIKDNNILAKKNFWFYLKASITDNLLDKKNWKETYNSDDSIFNEDLTDYNKYLPIVYKLSIDSPKHNLFYEMSFKNNTLYTTGGIYGTNVQKNNPGCIQVLKNDNWIIYEDNIDTITGYAYQDINCIDADPNDPEHVFAGGRTGLYEFKSGKLIKYYNKDNSILRPATTFGGSLLGNDYLLINGIKYDKEGNLWIMNSGCKDANFFVIPKNSQTVESRYNTIFNNDGLGLSTMRNMNFDSRNLLWMVNDNWRLPALFCIQTEQDKVIRYTNFQNQDGTSYTLTAVHCWSEDKEGNIWIGTNVGPFVIYSNDVGKENIVFNQIKVPRNDGTNLADYLLSGVDIRCMAIDGANRKWFGTDGNGVYVISSDNIEQIYHFTAENSDLLSNNINSIAINDKTGEVFIATNYGLCSYMNDATIAVENMDKDNVYAYPNPVRPEYNGNITIVGLTYNADVKITTATGYLVAEGRSNGGSFTWDGCDKDGKRVASGIYNVITATSTGEKGTVCKIAIIR